MPEQHAQRDAAITSIDSTDMPHVKKIFHYIIHLYEEVLHDFVRFCSSLPGFTKLPIIDQESIIKSRS